MDAYSRRIIGWSIDVSQTSQLVVDALAMAVARRQPEERSTIIHSDHGRSTLRGRLGNGCEMPGCSAPWVTSKGPPAGNTRVLSPVQRVNSEALCGHGDHE